MADSITFSVDAVGFRRALAAYLALSRRGVSAVVMQQTRLLLQRVIAITPPGGPGVSGSSARARGEASLRADLNRIFHPMTREALAAFVAFYGARSHRAAFAHAGAASLGEVEEKLLQLHEMGAWHDSHRRADGRVMRVTRTVTTGLRRRDMRGLDQGLVTRHDFETYYKKRAARIGTLAAGWVPALRATGGTAPAWISRHNVPGRLEIHPSDSGLLVTATNSAPFAGGVRGLQSRVTWAARLQEGAMARQVAHAMATAATSAGLG